MYRDAPAGSLGFGLLVPLMLKLLVERSVFVVAVPGVISAAAFGSLPGNGVSSPVLSGDRFLVLLVLGTLLVRLRLDVGLRLYSGILPLVNRFYETETVNILGFNYFVLISR